MIQWPVAGSAPLACGSCRPTALLWRPAAAWLDAKDHRLFDNKVMKRFPGLPPIPPGMTLIELLIVLVIVGILAGVAWPSFREAVHKSRRADAMSALTEIMQAQERWRSNRPEYSGTLSDLIGTRTTSRDGHYTLGVAVVSAAVARSEYTATATVVPSKPQASDTKCQVMRVAIRGGNITYNSGVSSDATNAQPDPCWLR